MKPKNALLLILCSFIWGTAFVAQSVGNNFMGPVTFQGVRSVLAALTLLPLVLVRRHYRNRRIAAGDRNVVAPDRKATITGGVLSGIFLTAASILQQTALTGTTVGKGGFLTALYIVMVPVFLFFLTRKADVKVWISVAIAVGGMYFLCLAGKGESGIGRYDLMLIFCAILFAFQILTIDHYGSLTDGIELSFAQFATAAVLGMLLAFLSEHPTLSGVFSGWFPLVYCGVLSSAVAYTFQIIGQKGQNPSIASLFMSLESVFSVLAGWVLLHQVLSRDEIIGCVLMFTAIITAQLPKRERKEVSHASS